MPMKEHPYIHTEKSIKTHKKPILLRYQMKIQREQSVLHISSFMTVNSTTPKFVRFILAGHGGTYNFNPSIWEAKAGSSLWVWGHPDLDREFQLGLHSETLAQKTASFLNYVYACMSGMCAWAQCTQKPEASCSPKHGVTDVAEHGIYEGPGTNALWTARNCSTGLVKWLS